MHRVVNWVLITFCRKIKQPFHNSRKNNNIGNSRFMGKRGTFWKITVHGQYRNHDSQVEKLPITGHESTFYNLPCMST